MFAIPFGRIVWKEYRSHRALWLSCLAVGCLYQVFNSFLIFDPALRSESLTYGVLFFPIMYCVGCCALLFPGEREDRTADWLISLSVPAGPTLSAKLGFGIVSVLAIQLVLVLFSCLLLRGSEFQLSRMLAPYSLYVFVWSAIGALLGKRVLASLPMMGCFCLLPLMVISAVQLPDFQGTDWMRNVLHSMTFVMMTVVGFGVVLWLGAKWCRGIYFHGPSFVTAVQPFTLFRGPLPGLRWWPSRLAVKTTESEQPWRRTWQRLVWQERHRESLSSWLFVIGAVLLPFLLARDTPLKSFGIGLFLVMPMAWGILGFRADNGFNQPRFLAIRGLSPAAIWLAKQAVWLPRALFFPVLMLLLLTLWHSNVPGWNTLPPQNLGSLISANPGATLGWVLFGYGCGQLAGLLSRRVVLAVAIACVLSLLAFFWFTTTIVLRIPQWWSIGLPVVALLALSFWQMKPWLLENRSWRNRGELVAATLTCTAVLVGLLAYYRIAEVSPHAHLDPHFSLSVTVPLPPVPLPTQQDERICRRLEQLSQTDPEGNDDRVRENERVREIIEILESRSLNISPLLRGSDSVIQPINSLRGILRSHAQSLLSENKLEESLACHLAALKLAQRLSQGPVHQWGMGSMAASDPLQGLVEWANHPSQTAASIRNAIKLLEEESNRFPSMSSSILDSLQSNRQKWITSSREQVTEELAKLHSAHRTEILHWVPSILPWERRRADLLMTHTAEDQFLAIRALEAGLNSPGRSDGRSVLRECEKREAANQPLQETTPFASFSSYPLNLLKAWVFDHQTRIRATLVRMELIACRQETGKLPDRLIQLMANLNGIHLIDPWSGRLFEFYPSFLLSSGRSMGTVIPVSPKEIEFVSGGMSLRHPALLPYQLPLSSSFDTRSLDPDQKNLPSVFPIPARPWDQIRE